AGSIEEQLKARFDPREYRLDIRRAPLLAAKVAEDPGQEAGTPGRWLLMLLNHHLVGDATTTQAMIGEVAAHLAGEAADLPAPPPFRDYVAQARLGRNVESDEVFFRDLLGTVSEPTLPYGLSDVQGDGGDIDEAVLPVAPGLEGRLRVQARRFGVSAASLFHLAWGRVLGGLSGRDDVVFGTVLLGRHGGMAEQALGMFINTLPLRLDLAVPVAEAVREAQRRLAGLLVHEHASLALAQRCSGVEAPLPLFSALLNYRHSAVGEVENGDEMPASGSFGMELLDGEERTNYPLTLSVDDRGEVGFSLTVQAVRPLEADRIGGYMQATLSSLVTALESAPEQPVRSLEILPPAERQLLLEDWNATEASYPSEQCIHELFEAQVQRSPEAVALVHGDETLSYGALNARANQLAHYLRELGVGPDDRVAICAERSLAMVVGLLGVLKAGGAYVPLDPEYPAERVAYMLEDSAPVAVLVHGDVPTLATGDCPVIALDDSAPW
ncbi:non-ribosomal peptide synthetase, partial [Marinobacter halodurans]